MSRVKRRDIISGGILGGLRRFVPKVLVRGVSLEPKGRARCLLSLRVSESLERVGRFSLLRCELC